MDGLIVIWSPTLSNRIAGTQQPEGVMASYHQAQKGVAATMLSRKWKNNGYNEPAKFKGIRDYQQED